MALGAGLKRPETKRKGVLVKQGKECETMIEISLPFPPSINALYGGGSGQRRFPSKKYKAWLAAVPELKQRVSGAIELEYQFFSLFL